MLSPIEQAIRQKRKRPSSILVRQTFGYCFALESTVSTKRYDAPSSYRREANAHFHMVVSHLCINDSKLYAFLRLALRLLMCVHNRSRQAKNDGDFGLSRGPCMEKASNTLPPCFCLEFSLANPAGFGGTLATARQKLAGDDHVKIRVQRARL
jgi:hypothetical protein